MSTGKTIRVVSLFCLILVAVGLVLAWNSPALQFEASIYSATPLLVWVFFIFSMVCGFDIIVQQVYTREYQRNNYWVVGLLLVMLPWITILLLPAIRGYLLSGNLDSLVHLGRTSIIQQTGHVGEQNPYPIMHIFVAQISQILGVERIVLFRFIPALFNVLYVVFMFLLARRILPDKGQAILVTAAATVVTFPIGHMIPWTLASLTLSLAIFLFVKGCGLQPARLRSPFRILLIFMLLLLPVFHILAAFGFGLLLVSIWLPGKIWKKWSGHPTFVSGNIKYITVACIILLVWTVAWISEFGVWESATTNLQIAAADSIQIPSETWITPQEIEMAQGHSHLQILIRSILYARSYGYNVAAQFFRVYGISAAYLALALFALSILKRRRRVNPELGALFCWYGPLIAFAVAIITLYLSNLPAWPNRLVRPMTMVSSIFVGFVFFETLEKAHSNLGKRCVLSKLCLFLVPIILISGYINSVLMQYPSSYNFTSYEYQLTRTEVAGMDWFLHKKDISISSVQVHLLSSRYADFLLTPEEKKRHEELQGWFSFSQPPFHFGYPDSPTLGAFYTEDNYMVLGKLDKVIYEEILPRMAQFRFTRSDFERLEYDPSLDKLHSNGEFDVWFIRALGEASDLSPSNTTVAK